MADKKARFSAERCDEPWHEEESRWNILSDNYKIREDKEKKYGRMSKN